MKEAFGVVSLVSELTWNSKPLHYLMAHPCQHLKSCQRPGPAAQSITNAHSEIVKIQVLFAEAKWLAYNRQPHSLYKIIIPL